MRSGRFAVLVAGALFLVVPSGAAKGQPAPSPLDAAVAAKEWG